MKPTKGLSDKELIEKYEAGPIELAENLKKPLAISEMRRKPRLKIQKSKKLD